MFEPVSSSLGILWFGYATASAYARRDSAVSSEANALREAVAGVVVNAQRSEVLFGKTAAALSELYSIAAQCSQPDWDGAGALPVDLASLSFAADFIKLIPSSLPLPEVTCDPDGAISLDWMESKIRVFSVSVSPSGRLSFAWLDGSDRGHGVARFAGGQIPPRVLEGIRSIVGYGDATLAA